MKRYLVYVRQYDIMINDYRLKVYDVFTDDIFRVIGKMYYEALKRIARVTFKDWSQARVDFFVDRGIAVRPYRERNFKV